MNLREQVKFCIDEMIKAGADKAQCNADSGESQEMSLNSNEISLLRTTFNTVFYLTAVKDGKKGSLTVNATDDDALKKAAADVVMLANSSRPDDANDISPESPFEEFYSGPCSADRGLMYDRLLEFRNYARKNHPSTILEEVMLDFSRDAKCFLNSNGAEFYSESGYYSFMGVFTSKEGKNTSSFNYTRCCLENLDRPFVDCGNVREILAQSADNLNARSVPGKFNGDIIITPDCLKFMLRDIVQVFLSDMPLIRGTSLMKDKLNQKVAADIFSVKSCPVSDSIVTKYFFTGDGFKTEDTPIITNGILDTFMLSLYGSKKTGLPMPKSRGGGFVVAAGDSELEEMIKNIRQGILLCRFSGGHPGENGEFSGVAKNSYYIENGKIAYPVKETMISGNLSAMLQNITAVSKERVHFGYSILPWLLVKDITVSGK